MYGIGGYGMNPMMMGGMMNGMMGGMMGTGSGNMNQYFDSTYGCADCFRAQPYLQEYPKPIMPLPKEERNQTFLSRMFGKFIGG